MVDIEGDVDELPLWTLSDDPILEVRGDTAPFIGRIGPVALLGDDRVLLVDSQSDELYLFDQRNATFDVVGGQGDGPGEFRAISTLSVTPGDTAYAFDRRHRRVSVFAPDGTLVRSIAIGAAIASDSLIPRRVWALASGSFVVQGDSPLAGTTESEEARRDQRDVLLLPVDGAGALAGSGTRYRGGYTIRAILSGRGIIIVAPFANVPVATAGGDVVVYGSGIDYELVLSTPDLRPSRIIRWPGWIQALSADVLNATRSEAEAQFRASLPERADLIVEAMFTPELLPETLPALGAALLDDRGRIWVARFQASTARWNQSDAWHVLDPEGTPLARLVLPDRARLAAVHGERVAVIVRDALDVEDLHIYTLER